MAAPQALPRQPYDSPAYNRPKKAANDNQARHNVRHFPADRTRGAKIERSQRASKNPGYKTTSDNFSDTYEKAGLSGQRQNEQAQPANDNDRTRNVDATYTTQPQYNNVVPFRRKKKVSAASKISARVRVSAANVWILPWAISFYLIVQLPFAFISIAALGMTFAAYEAVSSVIGDTATGFLVEKIGYIGSSFSTAVERAAEFLFGISFNPIMLFAAPFVLVFLLGMGQILLCWGVYLFTGTKSLSGKASTAKQTAFLFAIFGTFIPVLSLLPVIPIWSAVVWRYPQ